jgi:hypothetical protein
MSVFNYSESNNGYQTVIHGASGPTLAFLLVAMWQLPHGNQQERKKIFFFARRCKFTDSFIFLCSS